jgi:hypothetical protein
MSPGSRGRDNRTASGDPPRDEAPLGAMQEPLGSTERPVSRTSDENDVNLGTRTTTSRTGTVDRGRGFTTTFAIVAVVLLAAFLVALYLGSNGTNEATAPTGTQAPVAETSPATPDETTGSTTPATPQDAPATGGSGTGTGGGTTAPANP